MTLYVGVLIVAENNLTGPKSCRVNNFPGRRGN